MAEIESHVEEKKVEEDQEMEEWSDAEDPPQKVIYPSNFSLAFALAAHRSTFCRPYLFVGRLIVVVCQIISSISCGLLFVHLFAILFNRKQKLTSCPRT